VPASAQPPDHPRALDETTRNCEKALGTSIGGARGFQPPTFRSRNGLGPSRRNRSQGCPTITGGEGARVQPSQPFAEKTKNLVPESGRGGPKGAGSADPTGRARPHHGWRRERRHAWPRRPRRSSWRCSMEGRGRLLRVAEVAEQLGVCKVAVYRLCESGELPHVRVVNSIRIRPSDLTAYLTRLDPIP
jgi:excisionase family DNA binding protein